MLTKRMCTVCWWVACAFLLSNCRPPSQAATSLPRSEPIGSVTREKERVEVGIIPGALQVVVVSLPLFVGDLLRVSQGGQAILDFHDNLKLRLFNDTKLTIEALTESEGVPLQARLFLEDKGLTGELLAKNGRAEFTTPTGVKVAVLGTRFFIVYDPDKRLTTVGNFHGLVGVGTGVGSVAFLQPGYYLDAYENQPPGPQLPIPVTDVQFEAWASDNRSSIVAVDLLRIATPAVTVTPSPSPPVTVAVTTTVVPTATATTPAPIPIMTGTVIPDTGPTPAPPPGSPMAQVIGNAQCRTGPGSVFSPLAGLLPGMSLPIVGRLNDNSWWVVRLATQRASCWVWGRNVQVSGDLSRVPVIESPPTPSPFPALTVTPGDNNIIPVTETVTVTVTVTKEPISAPSELKPDSDLDCTDTVTLAWAPVSHPRGIARYEWQLDDQMDGASLKGETADTFTPAAVRCGNPIDRVNRSYTWRVRAIDGAGNAGPFAESKFSIRPLVRGPQILSIFVDPEPVCAVSQTTMVTVFVQAGDRSISAVVLDWATNGGTYTTQSMRLVDPTQGGGYYRGPAGPATAPGLLNLQITASDDLKNQATGTYDVKAIDCPQLKAITDTPVPTDTAIPAQAP